MAVAAEAVIQWVMVLIAAMLADHPDGQMILTLDEGDGVEHTLVVTEDPESPQRLLVFAEEEGEREQLGAMSASEDFSGVTWGQADGYEESLDITPMRALFESEDLAALEEEGGSVEVELGGETYTLTNEDNRLRVSHGDASVLTQPFDDDR